MIRVNGVDCGVTKQGNPYKKSSTGKNVGTALGLAMLYPATKLAFKRQNMTFSQLIEGAKDFINKGVGFGDKISLSVKFPKTADSMIKFLDKSKAARVCTLIGIIGVGAAACVALYGGLGRLAGSVFDKIRESGAKAEADRRADFDAKYLEA